uniref:Uncharacterized protein n=1 Tax=Rhizophora mucronata TaxID=61149 RepID=A0A2P2QFM6_RHIMU
MTPRGLRLRFCNAL